MKSLKWVVLVVVALALFGCASTPKSKFKLRAHKEVKLKNGLTVILVKDKRLPSFDLVMMVKAGSKHDFEGGEGIATMVGNLLEKGTSSRSALAFADEIGNMGADFGVSVSSDYTLIKGSSLSLKRDQFLSIFADAVLNPSFSEGEISRLKKQTIASLKRVADEPGGFSRLAFNNYLYGNHPYGKNSIGTENSVSKISRDEARKFYSKYYRPNNSILAVVGDYSDNIVNELENHFSKWIPGDIPADAPNAVEKINGRQVRVVHKPGLNQSQIVLGHIGIPRKNPDYLVLKVANSILGSGFSSRLMSEIRVKRGLTYHIGSYFVPQKEPGPFMITTFSRHDKVKEAIVETLNTVDKFKAEGVTKEEVEAAKAYLKGVFPRILETAESTAENLLVLKYYDVSDNYLSTFLQKMDQVTVDDVNQVIKKYVDGQNIKVLVLSDETKISGQLDGVGEVSVIGYKEAL